MWPISPVKPFAPRMSAPPAMTPPPMPVPNVTITKSSRPRAAPVFHSAAAAQVPSLSTCTVVASRPLSNAPTWKLLMSTRFGAARSTPPRVTSPGTPTPMESHGPIAAANSTNVSMMASGPFGVGRRCSSITAPDGSRITPRHLVPPTSMPRRRGGVMLRRGSSTRARCSGFAPRRAASRTRAMARRARW